MIPALWLSEITNVLGLAERRGRLSEAGVQDALSLLCYLQLIVEPPLPLAGSDAVLNLMRVYRLTAYDATYLEIAQRLRLPLATKDRELLAAARLADISLV